MGYWRLRGRLCAAVALLCASAPADDLPSTLKVRLFWMRHGQSCANVMDRCAVAPPESNALLPDVEQALRELTGFENASLSKEFGVKAASATEGDCVVEVTGVPALQSGQGGETGAILRAHDVYRDPALTDCSRRQCVQAGRSFVKWLKSAGLKLHYVGSSFLMRAFETAAQTFISPCSGVGAADCVGVLDAGAKVTPVPYMTERAPRGVTAVQADNTPRTIEEQSHMVEAAHGQSLPMDSTYANAWPRFAQQYEKFKAFLAVVLVPQALSGGPAETPETAAFRDALEKTLPETFHHEDHGKKHVEVGWGDSVYRSGTTLSKQDYIDLSAPEVNIAIVGHNQMMTEYCQGGHPPKPNNNAVLEKLFVLHHSGVKGMTRQVVLHELQGNCAKVMDAPDGKLSMASLTEADVATCNKPLEVSKWIGVAPSDAGMDTPCVQLGMDEHAYPIQPDFLEIARASKQDEELPDLHAVPAERQPPPTPVCGLLEPPPQFGPSDCAAAIPPMAAWSTSALPSEAPAMYYNHLTPTVDFRGPFGSVYDTTAPVDALLQGLLKSTPYQYQSNHIHQPPPLLPLMYAQSNVYAQPQAFHAGLPGSYAPPPVWAGFPQYR